MKNSQYGAHYSRKPITYLNRIIFPWVLKTLDMKVTKRYGDESFKFNDVRQATHPHQIHFEFLS